MRELKWKDALLRIEDILDAVMDHTPSDIGVENDGQLHCGVGKMEILICEEKKKLGME